MAIELKETNENYYLFVNRPELQKRAEELGYQGVMIFADEEFSKEDREMLKETCKDAIKIVYNSEKEYDECDYRRLRPRGETVDMTIELSGFRVNKDITIDSLEDAIQYFPTKEKLNEILEDVGKWTNEYPPNMCGNCHCRLGENDRYCRNCGTERGKGRFLPYRNIILCAYGPDIKTYFRCNACGHTWNVLMVGGFQSPYCPMCGQNAVETIKEEIVELKDLFDL